MKAPIPMDTEGTASHAPSSLISPLIAGASCVALFAASSFLFAQTTFSCLSYTSIYYADEDAHHVSAQRRLGSMRGVMISSTLDEREREGEDEAVHIVYGSDEHSIVGVEASIRSVQAHASDPSRLNFYFFGDEALPSLPEVKWFNLTDVAINYDVDSFTNPTYERKGKHKRKDGITINTNAANYIRFIMDDLLPVSAKKALWIDSDTIVRCDVVQMIENTLVDSDYIIAAIPVKGPPLGLTRVHRPNYKDIRWTFNAGVMVVDLEKWRKGKMTEVMRRFALKNREDEIYKYGSQPPLALTFKEDFEHLPENWNVKTQAATEEEVMDACILHWAGASKPWKGEGRHVEIWKSYEALDYSVEDPH